LGAAQNSFHQTPIDIAVMRIWDRKSRFIFTMKDVYHADKARPTQMSETVAPFPDV